MLAEFWEVSSFFVIHCRVQLVSLDPLAELDLLAQL